MKAVGAGTTTVVLWVWFQVRTASLLTMLHPTTVAALGSPKWIHVLDHDVEVIDITTGDKLSPHPGGLAWSRTHNMLGYNDFTSCTIVGLESCTVGWRPLPVRGEEEEKKKVVVSARPLLKPLKDESLDILHLMVPLGNTTAFVREKGGRLLQPMTAHEEIVFCKARVDDLETLLGRTSSAEKKDDDYDTLLKKLAKRLHAVDDKSRLILLDRLEKTLGAEAFHEAVQNPSSTTRLPLPPDDEAKALSLRNRNMDLALKAINRAENAITRLPDEKYDDDVDVSVAIATERALSALRENEKEEERMATTVWLGTLGTLGEDACTDVGRDIAKEARIADDKAIFSSVEARALQSFWARSMVSSWQREELVVLAKRYDAGELKSSELTPEELVVLAKRYDARQLKSSELTSRQLEALICIFEQMVDHWEKEGGQEASDDLAVELRRLQELKPKLPSMS